MSLEKTFPPLGPDEKPTIVASCGMPSDTHRLQIAQGSDGAYHVLLVPGLVGDSSDGHSYLASLWNSNCSRNGMASINIKDVAAVGYHTEDGLQFAWAEHEGAGRPHIVRLYHLVLAAEQALWERMRRGRAPFDFTKSRSDNFERMSGAKWALGMLTGIADKVYQAEQARLAR